MMMNRDTIVGIAGAAILLSAMVGILYVQGANAPQEAVYKVAWTTEKDSLPAITGRATNGAPSEMNVTLAIANLTGATFTLTWTDDDPSVADAFTLTVTTPSGKRLSPASGGSGTLTVTASPEDLNTPPATDQVAAGDEATARAKLADGSTKKAGMGEWLVTISVTARGNVPDNVPTLPTGPQPDKGNDWSLAVDYETYAPAFERAT